MAFIIKHHPLDFSYLSENEIARHFNISTCHLSRVFKKEKGISLKDFLIREKINRCKFLLIQDKTLTVKKLAAAIGYSSSNYFIRVFKKYVGVTPGKFRKMNGGFYGLNDRRKGTVDRRTGLKDRRTGVDHRKNKSYSLINKPFLTSRKRDRRQGFVDRRLGPRDRRIPFLKTFHEYHILKSGLLLCSNSETLLLLECFF